MAPADALCEGVRVLLAEAADFLAVRGLGMLVDDGPEHVIFTYVDGFGATGYRARVEAISESLRPREARREVSTIDLDAHPDRLVESRLLHPGLSEAIRREFVVHQTVAVAVPESSEPAVLVITLSEPGALTTNQRAGIDRLATRVADFLRRAETPEGERERSRRLEAVARMLPALVRVLDVREIFDQLSTIAKDVLRHDFANMGLFEDNHTRLALYVQTSGGPFEFRSGPMPFPPVQTDSWLYRFLDDLSTSPLERDGESVKAGGRSSIRVAIRLDDTILGAISFTSSDPVPYTATDLAVCRRIADYVAIALSHQRLAEEARLNEGLRARAANLALLDELLAALSDSGEIAEIFERISSLAHKVLPHDGLVLRVLLPDGRKARRYVSGIANVGTLPQTIDAPEALRKPDWEFDLSHDLTPDRTLLDADMEAQGFRSVLCVPVRLDGGITASMAFVSHTMSAFTPEDVLVARRIGDSDCAQPLARIRPRSDKARGRGDRTSLQP
jgi:GAF domain-containing protein